MKLVTYSILLFFSLVLSDGLKAQDFPEIQSYTLNNKKVSFPIQLSDKPILVGVIFSQKAQDDLYSWLNPVYNQVLDENGMGAMIYDCHVRLLITFTGAQKAAAKRAKEELKKATDEEFYPYILLHEGEYETFESSLKISDKKEAYFYVISPEGEILASSKGHYTQKKFDDLSEYLEY